MSGTARPVVTQFKQRDGSAGPVIGAMQVISVGFDDVANSETVSRRITFPAGMSFEITDIMVSADAVTSDPTLSIGSTAAGTQVVAAVAVTTDLGSVTIKEGSIAAAGFIDIVLVADAGDAAESVSLSVVGYVAAAPDSVQS